MVTIRIHDWPFTGTLVSCDDLNSTTVSGPETILVIGSTPTYASSVLRKCLDKLLITLSPSSKESTSMRILTSMLVVNRR